jgi:hypothetical protein
MKSLITFAAPFLGVEIHRGTCYCENKKSLKNGGRGKQAIVKPSFFRKIIFTSIMAGTKLEYKS